MIERLAMWAALGVAGFVTACLAINGVASAVLEALPR
jgi:hypothetical protein